MKENKKWLVALGVVVGLVGALVLAHELQLLPIELPFLSSQSSVQNAQGQPSVTDALRESQDQGGATAEPTPPVESGVPSAQASDAALTSSPQEGGQFPQGGAPSTSAAPSALAVSDQQLKGNIEIFREIYEVTLITEVKDLKQIDSWVNTLNQGASLEGVYHGLTKSNEYLALEKKSPPASAAAVKAFAEEMDELQQELPERFQNKEPAPAQVSIYTYKRLLGEEALKTFEIKYQDKVKDRSKLAMWYARLATRLARRQVDYGLALRNKADLNFHQTWALDAIDRKSEEQLKWEILNRLHRILNEANKIQADANRKEP